MKTTLALILTGCLLLLVPAMATAGGFGGSHGKGWSKTGSGAAVHQPQHRSSHRYAAPAVSWRRGATYPPHQHRSYHHKRKHDRHVPAGYPPTFYRSGIFVAEPHIVVRISL
jgi:hypothetical protein